MYSRNTTWATLFALAAISAEARGQIVHTIEPPPDIRVHLDKLKRGSDRTAAVLALGRDDRSAPYLRMELAVATESFSIKDMEESLREIEARTRERNKNRLAWWANARRFDLCNELLIDWPDRREAEKSVDIVAIAITGLAREAAAEIGIRLKSFDRKAPLPGFGFQVEKGDSLWNSDTLHFDGTRVVIPERARRAGILVRADRFEEARSIDGLFGAIRTMKQSPGMRFSIVIVGNSTEVVDFTHSLLICDGDVALEKSPDCYKSIIIANGSIKSTDTDFAGCILGATGDIQVACPRHHWTNKLYAGGAVKLGGTTNAQVHEKQQRLPFGVRFFDPSDLGITVAAKDGSVSIRSIESDSVFAMQGVHQGDVVTKIDEVAPKSVDAFRRALRAGVIRESVVLHIKRNGKDITRIVFLDGIPLPLAPPPRSK